LAFCTVFKNGYVKAKYPDFFNSIIVLVKSNFADTATNKSFNI